MKAIVADTLLSDDQTWADAGRPNTVGAVLTPKTIDHTEHLLSAIESSDVHKVRCLPDDGEDPTCSRTDCPASAREK